MLDTLSRSARAQSKNESPALMVLVEHLAQRARHPVRRIRVDWQWSVSIVVPGQKAFVARNSHVVGSVFAGGDSFPCGERVRSSFLKALSRAVEAAQ